MAGTTNLGGGGRGGTTTTVRAERYKAAARRRCNSVPVGYIHTNLVQVVPHAVPPYEGISAGGPQLPREHRDCRRFSWAEQRAGGGEGHSTAALATAISGLPKKIKQHFCRRKVRDSVAGSRRVLLAAGAPKSRVATMRVKSGA